MKITNMLAPDNKEFDAATTRDPTDITIGRLLAFLADHREKNPLCSSTTATR